MNLRINDLHWQRHRQFRQGCRSLAAYLRANTGSRALYAHGNSSIDGVNFAKHDKLLGVLPNQMLEAPSPKRASATQHIDGLQQTGLAGSVRSADQGELGIQLELRRLQAAEVR